MAREDGGGGQKRDRPQQRGERLAAELRANLKKRKDQARARERAPDGRGPAAASTSEDGDGEASA
jgi:hypothetical protein